MPGFFKYFQDNYVGIIIFLVFAFVVILLLNWLAKIFAIGRYKNPPKDGSSGNVVFVFSQLMVKIITDFRHLLALVLVLIFAISLGVVFYVANGNPDDLIKLLQAVVATLGGLVGSIVGYYFGESAARGAKNSGQPQIVEDGNPTVQNTESDNDIKRVVTPGLDDDKPSQG